MTDTTPRSGLPLLAAAQAQKHVTHNEALLKLDALLFARLLDRDLAAPPSTPADGDTYLIAASATGAWSGHDGAIAYAVDGGWRFYPPFTGLAAYVVDESRLIVFDGAAWLDYAQILSLQNLPLVGVNTAADTTNRLAVKSPAVLLDNDGAGVQAKINKHATADTASLLFQTNHSGRAEIGLTGDDNLHVRASPDGAIFTDALVIDSAGRVLLDGQTQAYAVTNNNTVVTPTLQLAGQGPDASILFARFSAGGSPARFTFGCSKGSTRGDFSSVADGSTLGRLSFNGADGVQFKEAAWISAYCDQTPTTGNVPGKIAFGTMPPGGTLTLDRMCIFNDGNVFIGTGITTRPVCKLDVDGPIRVKSYAVAAVPSAAAGAGQIVYVSDESGGAVLAFSDGVNWRRATDRAVVS